MIETIAQIHHDDMVPIVAIGVGGGVAFFWILLASVGKAARHKELEKSRREIAAYIAEGSMTPEQGERLLNAGAKD